MEEAEKICDEIAFLHQGEIIKQTTMDHLLKSNANPEIFFQLEEKQEHSIDPDLFGDVQESSNGYLLKAENPIQTMEHVLNICKMGIIKSSKDNGLYFWTFILPIIFIVLFISIFTSGTMADNKEEVINKIVPGYTVMFVFFIMISMCYSFLEDRNKGMVARLA